MDIVKQAGFYLLFIVNLDEVELIYILNAGVFQLINCFYEIYVLLFKITSLNVIAPEFCEGAYLESLNFKPRELYVKFPILHHSHHQWKFKSVIFMYYSY